MHSLSTLNHQLSTAAPRRNRARYYGGTMHQQTLAPEACRSMSPPPDMLRSIARNPSKRCATQTPEFQAFRPPKPLPPRSMRRADTLRQNGPFPPSAAPRRTKKRATAAPQIRLFSKDFPKKSSPAIREDQRSSDFALPPGLGGPLRLCVECAQPLPDLRRTIRRLPRPTHGRGVRAVYDGCPLSSRAALRGASPPGDRNRRACRP